MGSFGSSARCKSNQSHTLMLLPPIPISSADSRVNTTTVFQNPHVVLNAFCPTGGTTNVSKGQNSYSQSERCQFRENCRTKTHFFKSQVPVLSCLMGLAKSFGFFKQFARFLTQVQKAFTGCLRTCFCQLRLLILLYQIGSLVEAW